MNTTTINAKMVFEVDGQKKRARSETEVYCLSNVNVDITCVASNDAPVAITYKEHRNKPDIEIRAFDDRLFVAETVYSDDMGVIPMSVDMLAGHASGYWMWGSPELGDEIGDWFYNEAVSDRIRLGRFREKDWREGYRSDEQASTTTMHNRANRLLVVDGHVWRQTMQPVYLADPGKRSYADRSDSPYFVFRNLIVTEPTAARMPQYRADCFAIDDFSGANSWIEALTGEQIDPWQQARVLMPEALNSDDPANRLTRLLGIYEHRTIGDVPNMPRETMSAWSMFRDELKRVEADPEPDEVALNTLANAAMAYAASENRTNKNAIKIMAIVDHWLSRDITLEAMAPM